MAQLKQTAFRLDEEDFEILDAIKQEMGLAARSDALRYVLRQHARERGLTVGKTAKPSSKPKGSSRRK